ncbi:MAG: class I SAM-dependent RNA methyltransferase [Chthoniobacterales bacterium]
MRTVELKIEDIAFGGKGVGRDNGKAVFIPFTIDDETVTADIVREKKQFAEAELVDIRQASEHRTAPVCPYFARCGGCAYQHINYEHQLQIKWRQVRDVLRRIGKIPEPPIRPIVASPNDYAYRNRITVHVQDGVIGFFRRESNRLIDIERCPISMKEVNEGLRELRAANPKDGHYALRAGNGPRIFAQTNDAVAEALRQQLISMISPGQDLLIDTYCGSGFFAKALIDKFQRIIGIDWDKFAIAEARKNATDKEIYIAGDVEEELTKLLQLELPPNAGFQSGIGGSPMFTTPLASGQCHERNTSLTVLIDPPADGLSAGVLDTMAELRPQTLIYVSCNPATLARDLNRLAGLFSIQSVTPFDMFPQTAEIEVLTHLTLSTN